MVDWGQIGVLADARRPTVDRYEAASGQPGGKKASEASRLFLGPEMHAWPSIDGQYPHIYNIWNYYSFLH